MFGELKFTDTVPVPAISFADWKNGNLMCRLPLPVTDGLVVRKQKFVNTNKHTSFIDSC